MQTAIIGTIIGIVLFLCLLLGFRYGLRLGMNAAKGIIPPPLKSPVQAVIEQADKVKAHQESVEYDKELAEMMAFTGDKKG